MAEGEYDLPNGWDWVRMRDVCLVNPRKPRDLERGGSAPTSFVPMAAVDEVSGTIAERQERPYSRVKKGYTYFEEDDVLFAKITPCMENGKHVVARDLTDGIGFGTTEFHVLRPGEAVLPEWIHAYVRQPSVRTRAAAVMTGAVGQQRVPKKFLGDLPLPLPPIAEQTRLISELQEKQKLVASARVGAETQQKRASAMQAACLRDVFEGDEAATWPLRRLGDITTLSSGGTPSRKVPGYFGGDIPWVKTLDLTLGLVSETEEHITPKGLGAISGGVREPGSVMVAMYGGAGTIGKSGILDLHAATNQAICVLDPAPDVYDPRFLHAWLLYYRPKWMDFSRGNRKDPNINKGIVTNAEIPLPDLDRQREVADQLDEQMEAAADLRAALADQLTAIEALPAALLRDAFSGRL